MRRKLPDLLRGSYALRILFELDRLALSPPPQWRLMSRTSLLGRLTLPALPKPELVRARVAAAHIEQLFAAGPDEVCRIYEYVAEPWRSVFLGQKPKSIENMTRLVARNLDWYLEPPAPLFRAEWWYRILGGALVIAGLGASTALALLFLSGYYVFALAFCGFIGVVPLWAMSLVLSIDYNLHRIYINELRRYLREVFRYIPEEDSS